MSNIKIGDPVRASAAALTLTQEHSSRRDGIVIGRLATSRMLLVDFGTGYNGHTGFPATNILSEGRYGKAATCWYVHEKDLEVVPQAPTSVSSVQTNALLQHLLAGNTITPLEALGVFNIYRLAARIFDLKKRGHKIVTNMKRDAKGKQYAEYSLLSRSMRA